MFRNPNSSAIIYDCVVVGAGIEGSCTARYAASLGKKTLCLEQFPLPHVRGSSHGQSRITRYSYEQSFLADMMPEAFALWAEIERLAKTKLFINCGCLTVDSSPYTGVNKIADNLKSNGISGEYLSSQELKDKFMLHYPNSFIGFLEKTGGVLLASKCLRAVQDQFVKFGGVLHDNEKVTEIIPGHIVKVKTNKGMYLSKKVILTPGPWANTLLKSLGIDLQLKPKRVSVCYWKVKQSGFDALDNYPCWIDHTSDDGVYSLPCYEYPNMIKLCLHNGADVDPDVRDDIDCSWIENKMIDYVKRHVKGIETKPSIVEHCMYTISPDWIFTLDRHPKFNNIVMGVGFSVTIEFSMSERPEDSIYDCVVVGAGIEGSCSARYAASLGKKTLCLEQFPLPHNRGSSHGQSRITRHSHDERYLADMMPEAFAMWDEIEQMAKTKLFINCGYLVVDTPPYTSLRKVSDNLKSNGIPGEVVTSKELKDKYMMEFPDTAFGLFEKTGGVLLASKCLRAVQDQFVKFDGILQDNEKVTEIIPGHIVKVKTNKRTYLSRKVILTPGPWASSVLKPLSVDLPLQPKRLCVFYWKVKQNGFDASCGYPTWYGEILHSANNYKGFIYSTPCLEYQDLIKICYHDGPESDPDARDNVDYSQIEHITSEYIRHHIKGVETKPSIVEHCMYTVTPDRKCILDRHPQFNNIIMGVGFSGSGFKLSPVFGKILVQLAFGLEPSYDLKYFKMARFQNSTPKSSL